jgi:uncharacterized membrane protein
MQQELTVTRPIAWGKLASLAGLLVVGLVIPNLGWPQAVTGTLVNGLLLLTVMSLGVGPAMLVGMVTPIAAAASGLLPLPLLVMVPFIAPANATLVAVYGALASRNRIVALVVAAVAKFALLFAMVELLVTRPLTLAMAGGPQVVKMPATIVYMMQWPQLATALAGGVLAFGIAGAVRWARTR